jgi:NAD(P)-dependent dehydrogenase (short-subunit alcohol dehydrogenase family)
MLLENKIAIVTGGGSGIGEASAIAMAAEGATIVIGNRSADTGEAVCHKIETAGGTAIFQRTDVAKAEDNAALVARAESEYGRLDLAFCNAGIFMEDSVPIDQMPDDQIERGIAINLTGTIYTIKYAVGAMLRAGGGSIVNNSSIFGLQGMVGLSWYTAAKHGINGITKNTALEYATQNIRVNSICPGMTKTPAFDLSTGGDDELFAGVVPMGRISMADEVADAVVFLLSDKARYITGAILSADGGMSA